MPIVYANIPQSIYCSRLTYLPSCLGFFHTVNIGHPLDFPTLVGLIWSVPYQEDDLCLRKLDFTRRYKQLLGTLMRGEIKEKHGYGRGIIDVMTMYASTVRVCYSGNGV